jgi:16S rRNA (guanine966-N2)-methyltransferase
MKRKPKKQQKEKKTPSSQLRPVGARALKSATDRLRPWLAGSRVLDLYAGQGRFGRSTLEEDAREVVFVELNSRTARELEELTAREADRRRVINQDVFHYLARGAEVARYDLVFADPPFPFWSPEFEKKLMTAVIPWLAPEAIFLVKHPSGVLLSPADFGLTLWKDSLFGESRLSYLKYGEKSEGEGGDGATS